MITRALYLSGGWFAISLLAMMIGGTKLRRTSFILSAIWLSLVILLGDLWAILTFAVPWELAALSAIALIFGVFWIWWLKDINALGQIAWSMTLLVTFLFILYAFLVTAFTPLNPLSFILALFFFFIEVIALLLALTHMYESLDVTCRVKWHRRVNRLNPIPEYTPMVSLQLPTYNEPPEVVAETLRSLARLDYPNYEVLVVDNNTPEESTWRPLEELCRQLGPNFRLLHLDKWPGYKSGALNFALTQTHPEAEIIGTIDSDYQLSPAFLKELVPAFVDPMVAFVQTPQDYRDFKGDPYSEAIYYGYKYFFEISMPSRNEHNAIIFAGTMGLIRKSVLQEIGGWDEWCITEDAEASLRILKRGYKSLYINRSYGRGLMPFNFDGLKKQRFRWCFGGIQILKKHWESLMPWAHWIDPNNRMTLQQRYYYLVGGLQWFTDVFNLIFAFLLVLGGIFSMSTEHYTIRPLTSPLLIMPAVFLFLNLWRFLWVLRNKLRLTWVMALLTMYNFFSMGWAVTLACIQGLIQPKGVFLRTPKVQSSSKFLRALRVTQWETLIGLICMIIGTLAFITNPSVRTFFLGSLLVWQASIYLAAPFFSLLSTEKVEVQTRGSKDQGTGILEQWAARWAVAITTLVFLVGASVQLLPQPAVQPLYSQFQPEEVPPERLLGIEQVPIEQRATPPTPRPTRTPMPTATEPAMLPVTALPTLTDTTIPTGTKEPEQPTQTATVAPSSTPLPTDTATAVPTDTAAPTATPQPSSTPTQAATSVIPTVTVVETATSTPELVTPTATSGTPTPTGTPVTGGLSLQQIISAADLRMPSGQFISPVYTWIMKSTVNWWQ